YAVGVDLINVGPLLGNPDPVGVVPPPWRRAHTQTRANRLKGTVMRVLRATMIAVGIIQILTGAIFLVSPARYAELLHLQPAGPAGLGELAIGNVRRQIRGLWHRYVRRRSGTMAQSSLDRHHDRHPGRRLHRHCRLSGRRCRVAQTVPGGRAAIAVDRTPRMGPHAGSRRGPRIVAARVGNCGWRHLMRTADQAVDPDGSNLGGTMDIVHAAVE